MDNPFELQDAILGGFGESDLVIRSLAAAGYHLFRASRASDTHKDELSNLRSTTSLSISSDRTVEQIRIKDQRMSKVVQGAEMICFQSCGQMEIYALLFLTSFFLGMNAPVMQPPELPS